MREYGTNETEQRIIRSIGGTPHKNSGRGLVKGDGTWHDFTIDVKEGKTFRLTVENWSKICTDAIRNRSVPLLMIVLNGQSRIAMLEWEVLEELVDKAERYDRASE